MNTNSCKSAAFPLRIVIHWGNPMPSTTTPMRRLLLAGLCLWQLQALGAEQNAISMTCTAVSASGIRWSQERQRFESVDFKLSSYLANTVAADGTFCPTDRGFTICLMWRNVGNVKSLTDNIPCYWTNASDALNVRLSCESGGGREMLIIDLKRGTYVYARNGGLPLYGKGWEQQFNMKPGDGHADSSYVEYGVCNDLTQQ